jgi:hypothetical protein
MIKSIALSASLLAFTAGVAVASPYGQGDVGHHMGVPATKTSFSRLATVDTPITAQRGGQAYIGPAFDEYGRVSASSVAGERAVATPAEARRGGQAFIGPAFDEYGRLATGTSASTQVGAVKTGGAISN